MLARVDNGFVRREYLVDPNPSLTVSACHIPSRECRTGPGRYAKNSINKYILLVVLSGGGGVDKYREVVGEASMASLLVIGDLPK